VVLVASSPRFESDAVVGMFGDVCAKVVSQFLKRLEVSLDNHLRL
jgi:hypothetical protein